MVSIFTEYTTTKVVRIRDVRLQVVYILCCIVVTVYVLVDLLCFHRYARYQVPVGFYNTWSTFQSSLLENPGSSSYCHEDFGYDPDELVRTNSGGWRLVNQSCVPFSPARHFRISSAEIHVAVHEFVVPPGCFGVECGNSYFVEGAERAIVFFQSGISTDWMQVSNPVMDIFAVNGSLVKSIPQGGFLSLTLGDWLDIAGVRLSDSNIGTTCGYSAPICAKASNYPRGRVSGLSLLVALDFSNFRTWSFDRRLHCRVTVRHQPGLWGFEGGKEEYRPEYGQSVTVFRNHVILKFITQGQLGKFSFFETLLSVISGVVLIGVARRIVDMLAAHTMVSRDAFQSSKFETVDLKKTVQSMMVARRMIDPTGTVESATPPAPEVEHVQSVDSDV
eukprot:TRINITY_DN2132_c0_g1_i2.p1 TRINITY_DN2132_c0_g1~~TRINITY_DN2132_c0_g1_i2.p1  ORF type:complete len:390 (+),score=27.41 TRINITY_DN2132_c0_g1_i2:33-1202(+)